MPQILTDLFLRALNLVAHTWFGLGMWVGGLLLTLVY